MPDYQKLYTLMFNAATDAIIDMRLMNFGIATAKLISAQQKAEKLYISQDEDENDTE